MNVGSVLRRVAEEHYEKEGIIFETPRMTYGEFNSRVNRLANGLNSIGIRKGDRAAVLPLNCSQYLEIYFAAAKLGIILVTLNYRLTVKELEYIGRVAVLGKKSGVQKVSLLPYHEGGKSKSKQMGESYPFSRERLLNDDHVYNLKAVIERCGLAASVGN